jgi:malonyl-CoA O-methyltransferase
VIALPARDAYAHWAATYESETAISFLENSLFSTLAIPTVGARLLDVGCGTARRLHNLDAELAIGVDASFEMVLHSRDVAVSVSDARALPFKTAAFDVVWCRLMIGHVQAMATVFAELSRVVRDGGIVVVTDLAVEAIRAGHRRTFRDRAGTTREIEHFVHNVDDQVAAAQAVQLEVAAHRTAVVGPEIRHFYAHAGRLSAYEQQIGLPLVVALSFRKTTTVV